jgi:hypothetical protein
MFANIMKPILSTMLEFNINNNFIQFININTCENGFFKISNNEIFKNNNYNNEILNNNIKLCKYLRNKYFRLISKFNILTFDDLNLKYPNGFFINYNITKRILF